ncbi:hypothetical protein ACFX12_019942 [Malus domestica]
MLKQSPSRNQRSKGFKVKHAVQISLLLAICIWLLYQLKHSHDKKAYEESSGTISGKMQKGDAIIKLGRRDLYPRVDETSLDNGRHKEKEDSEEEMDESKSDEIDGHDLERAEEESEAVEDLIDEEDTEREEESEEQESDEEILKLLDDQSRSEDTRNTEEMREEHYKADDASGAVKQNIQTLSTEIEIGSLRKVKEEEVENAEKIEVEREIKTNGILGFIVGGAAKNAVQSEESGKTYSSIKTVEELKLSNDSLNGTEMLPKLYRDASRASGQGHLYLEAFLSPKSKDLQSGSNTTLSLTDDLDATKREVAATGSETESVVSEATAKLAKSSNPRSTSKKDDEVGNVQSNAYGRVERSVGSLMALETNENVGAVRMKLMNPIPRILETLAEIVRPGANNIEGATE